MDDSTHTLISLIIDQANVIYRQSRHVLSEFYLWSDKRPGTVVERFEADAKSEWDYRGMFRV